MPRVRVSLNGPWEFAPDPKDAYRPDNLPAMRPITVPGGWEHQFPGEAELFGRAWYRKRFHAPPEWTGHVVFLHFGAVNYHCRVWVNDALIGEHEGGYTPFSFRIDPHLRL